MQQIQSGILWLSRLHQWKCFRQVRTRGVCLGLSSREEVCQAFNQMKDLSETFLVEEMVKDTVTEVLACKLIRSLACL